MYVFGGTNSNTVGFYDAITEQWTMYNKIIQSSTRNAVDAFVISVDENTEPKNIIEYYSG